MNVSSDIDQFFSPWSLVPDGLCGCSELRVAVFGELCHLMVCPSACPQALYTGGPQAHLLSEEVPCQAELHLAGAVVR